MESSKIVTADAMKAVYNGSPLAAKVIIIAGIGGIVTSWNSFFVGGSRAIYSMAESKMLPEFLAKLHTKHKTPTNAVLLIGIVSSLAPLLGRKMMVWLVDAGGFTIVVAYLLVAISFSGCFTPSTIDAGEEGVLIKKPWFFGHGGVEPEPIKTGLTWTAFSTSVERVNVKPFSITELFDDLITIDNNPVDFYVNTTFKHTEGKTPELVEKFGLNRVENGNVVGGWYGNKVKEPFRNFGHFITLTIYSQFT